MAVFRVYVEKKAAFALKAEKLKGAWELFGTSSIGGA